MSRVEYIAECGKCPHAVTDADRSVVDEQARQHANARPGHQVVVWRVYWPDGGRDWVSSTVSHTTKGKRLYAEKVR